MSDKCGNRCSMTDRPNHGVLNWFLTYGEDEQRKTDYEDLQFRRRGRGNPRKRKEWSGRGFGMSRSAHAGG